VAELFGAQTKEPPTTHDLALDLGAGGSKWCWAENTALFGGINLQPGPDQRPPAASTTGAAATNDDLKIRNQLISLEEGLISKKVIGALFIGYAYDIPCSIFIIKNLNVEQGMSNDY
jgi:hypothetical protein